jgi:kumamolisin
MDGEGDSPEGLTPDYIRQLYDFDPLVKKGLSGKGQHIAIAGYDGYNIMDVGMYFGTMVQGTAPKFDEVIFNGDPGPDEDSAAENELDIELSGMIAPGSQIHAFFSEHNDDPGEVQLFTAILDDNRAKIANYSWGDCESNVSVQHRSDMDHIFSRAVAQGVTIVAASGDWGSSGCPDHQGVMGDWPSAHPYVMSIGGTSIWQDDFSHKITEQTWEDTGGGFSTLWNAPPWQKSIGQTGMRAFPDVSFNADPNTGEPVYLSYPAIPKWIQVGGTSIAAPQWSGFIALLNEARGAKGAIGFLPPYLYGLTPAQRALSFRDIVQGKNGAYSAGPGWDNTTGFGSPLAAALLDQLVGQ